MNEETQGGQRTRKRLWLALAALAVLLALLIVPPFVSVSRYKTQITRLISASLGRPVRLASVEVRLLPWPGFVLTDLTVAEDPAYGAEPVLHANTVTASIRLLSLWRGRLEIDSISVDEASLNLVRTPEGRWNLDPLLRTASAHVQSARNGAKPGQPVKLPYLEATNSRINIMNGDEKLPFSLLNADISFWQQNPGEWRVRLRGQPVRTDLSLAQADTGIVRLEADLHPASELRRMQVQLDLEWSQAQLGQLTRLLLGNDAGWRGNLTGDFHLDGTAEAANITARLRASSVHRTEFEPAEPMDFDANCSLVAHFFTHAFDNLVCDSPLGDGHIRLTGDRPGDTALPRFSVELDRISAPIALEALRTVRSGLAPGLDASGTASGKITYAPSSPGKPTPGKRTRFSQNRAPVTPVETLTGSIAVNGFELSGGGLSQPIRIPKLLFTPAPAPANQLSGSSPPPALVATLDLPAGAAVPLTVFTRLQLSGYLLLLRGEASIVGARELAEVAGLPDTAGLNQLTGDPISVDLTAEGPWTPIPTLSFGNSKPAPQPLLALPVPLAEAAADSLTGTVTLHIADWKANFLASDVMISQATLHVNTGQLRWDPIDFSYGPVKGTASLTLPTACQTSEACSPQFQVQFGALDAAVLQEALLGARERTTLLSALLNRFRSSPAPAWPQLEGTLKAASLQLGPVTLHDPAATVRLGIDGAEVSALDAGLLGGRLQATGTIHTATSDQDKPSYAFTGQFEKLSPAAVGELLRLHCSGGGIDGKGKIELSGFTAEDLEASAKGALSFDWPRGSISSTAKASEAPAQLSRFDRWNANAEIANGLLTLEENQLQRGAHTEPVQATITFAHPPKIAFPQPNKTLKKTINVTPYNRLSR